MNKNERFATGEEKKTTTTGWYKYRKKCYSKKGKCMGMNDEYDVMENSL